MKNQNLVHAVILLATGLIVGCGEHGTPSKTSKANASTSLASESSSNSISIGDKIDDARVILDAFQKDNSVGGFAFVKGPDDIENIFVRLDQNHMNACIWYSKTSRIIKRISVICFPTRRSGKASQSWIAAQSMQFDVDGTHTIQFAKPLTLAELEAQEAEAAKNRPQMQIPSGGKAFK